MMQSVELLYSDVSVAVIKKACGILSTDEPGGAPEQVRAMTGLNCVKTVHRLDRVVGGLMVLALSDASAAELSRQVRDNLFRKEYCAVVHGTGLSNTGSYSDLIRRDPKERKSYLTDVSGKDSRPAILNYRLLGTENDLSAVAVELITGRTHQIRAQFSGHGFPIWGDRKYCAGSCDEEGEIALWSRMISFLHPLSGDRMTFLLSPPEQEPWTCFRTAFPENFGSFEYRQARNP